MRFSNWLGLSGLLIAGTILWTLREILILIFAGIIIAMAICTLVDKLRQKISISRPIAFIICLLIILLVFGLALIVVVPPFSAEVQQLIIQLPQAWKELYQLLIGLIKGVNEYFYGGDPNSSLREELLLNSFNLLPDGSTLATGIGDGFKKLVGFAGNLGSGLIRILFVLAVSLMISIQPNSYRDVAIQLVPSFYRRRAKLILTKCGYALSSWMVGVLISSICVAILAGIGLSILGVKLVIANALLAGMLNIIPNVGPVISTIFPMSVALLEEPWKAVAVLGMYIVIQNLESYFITPSVMHHQVKLLPGLTLIAQFTFTIIFGPIGLFLALPMAVVLQVIIKEIIIHDLLDNWKSQKKLMSR